MSVAEVHPHRRPRTCPSWAPSTGQLCGPPLVGKTRRYVCGKPPVTEASELHRSSVACQCCVILWDANDLVAISFLHSPHCTRSFCCSWYVGPSPVIFLPYAATNCVPATWNGRQTMLNVFPKFVCRPNRSNTLTNVSNAYCSQQGSEDATMPSSAYNREAWCLPSSPLSPRPSPRRPTPLSPSGVPPDPPPL